MLSEYRPGSAQCEYRRTQKFQQRDGQKPYPGSAWAGGVVRIKFPTLGHQGDAGDECTNRCPQCNQYPSRHDGHGTLLSRFGITTPPSEHRPGTGHRCGSRSSARAVPGVWERDPAQYPPAADGVAKEVRRRGIPSYPQMPCVIGAQPMCLSHVVPGIHGTARRPADRSHDTPPRRAAWVMPS